MARPDEETCPHCQLTYSAFRTGLRYKEVWAMIWVNSDDPADWKYKRRGSVLRLFNDIKLKMWEEHIVACEQGSPELTDAEWAECTHSMDEY